MVSDLRVRLSHWENTLKLNQALTKSMNMDICVICTLNQLKKVSYNQINFQKKTSPFFETGPFYTLVQCVLTLAFDRDGLFGNVALSIVVHSTKKR